MTKLIYSTALALILASSSAIARPTAPRLPPQFVGHFCVDHAGTDDDASPEHNISRHKRVPMSKPCPSAEDELEIIPTGMRMAVEVICTFLEVEALSHQGYRVHTRCQQDGDGITIRDWWLYPDDDVIGRGPYKAITLDAIDDSPATTATSRPAVPAPDPGEPSLGLWDRLSK